MLTRKSSRILFPQQTSNAAGNPSQVRDLQSVWISFFGSLGKRHGGGNNHDEALCESLTNEPRQYLADD